MTALARTRAFLAHSWPLDMLPEVEACEREVENAVDAVEERDRLREALHARDVLVASLTEVDPHD